MENIFDFDLRSMATISVKKIKKSFGVNMLFWRKKLLVQKSFGVKNLLA